MKNITFKQFLYTFNFREFRNEDYHTKEGYNTKIIRIYYPMEDFSYTDDYWIEFGLNDFISDESKEKLLKMFFTTEILNSYIGCIEDQRHSDCIELYLTFKEEG